MLDDGTVSGVGPKAVASIERNIVNVANDPSMFNVAPALEFERLEGDGGKTVIRVWVPMGGLRSTPSRGRFTTGQPMSTSK